MKKAPSQSVEDAAADWLVRRHSGFVGREEAEFASWLSEDSSHRAAFSKLEDAWRTLNRPREFGRASLALDELRRRRRRRAAQRAWAAGAGLAVVLGLSAAGLRLHRPELSVEQADVVVRSDLQYLPDRSVVRRNDGARIYADYTPAERRVRLEKGEATFSVAKDPARPFVVVAGTVQVWAVGTAFNVCLRPDAVDVLVTEGKVRVDPPEAGAAPIAVAAGQRATVSLAPEPSPTLVTSVSPGDIEKALAWQSKRFEFTRAPLSRVLDVFNGENAVKLVIGDPALRDLPITGIYWADDPDGFVRLLNSGLIASSERRDGVVILRSR